MKFLKDFTQFINESVTNFDFHQIAQKFKGGWFNISEGLKLVGNNVEIDFENDSDEDSVKLQNPKGLKIVKKEKVPVYRGFALERVDNLKAFMERIKQEGQISEEELKKLIALTYPKELIEKKITLLFITGSSDPLSVNIANALKDMYYPEAKVVDVIKKYYGADVNQIVDWDKYEDADPTTREMIDTYLSGFKYRKNKKGQLIVPPRNKFEGYIKKSSGLQSGARPLLKSGHDIDNYIVSNIISAENEWKKNYMMNRSISQSAALKYRPCYLVVDDTIIEGSTLRGIFKELQNVLSSPELKSKIGEFALRNIYGYCLFSYKRS